MTAHELATAYVDAYGGRIEAEHDGAVMVNTGFPMPDDFDEAMTFIIEPNFRLHDGDGIAGHLWQLFIDVNNRPEVWEYFRPVMARHAITYEEGPFYLNTTGAPSEIASFVVGLWALVSVVYHVEARPLEMLRAAP